ncbi:MAG: hypothetical protein DMG88_15830 [Acidobacteria bacterium]|nr:MAG: hypothetical protein DMG88_15830 [Acidobacteriota bacterium]
MVNLVKMTVVTGGGSDRGKNTAPPLAIRIGVYGGTGWTEGRRATLLARVEPGVVRGIPRGEVW